MTGAPLKIAACLSLALLAGCVSKGKYNGVVQELDEMTQEDRSRAEQILHRALKLLS